MTDIRASAGTRTARGRLGPPGSLLPPLTADPVAARPRKHATTECPRARGAASRTSARGRERSRGGAAREAEQALRQPTPDRPGPWHRSPDRGLACRPPPGERIGPCVQPAVPAGDFGRPSRSGDLRRGPSGAAGARAGPAVRKPIRRWVPCPPAGEPGPRSGCATSPRDAGAAPGPRHRPSIAPAHSGGGRQCGTANRFPRRRAERPAAPPSRGPPVRKHLEKMLMPRRSLRATPVRSTANHHPGPSKPRNRPRP